MNDSTLSKIIVEWCGPYSIEEVEEYKEWEIGVYLITKKQENIKKIEICYCGIT